MKSILLIELDGILIDTAHEKYKPFKDGIQETNLDQIPLIYGAKDFVKSILENGHHPIIISDSHSKYVNKIANQIFSIPALSLADNPNPEKTISFLKSQFKFGFDNFPAFVIGNTWHDIEFGRALNFLTVLTNFNVVTNNINKEGIGQDRMNYKSGPTFYATNFQNILDIIDNPEKNLLAVEAIFQNINSSKAVRLETKKCKNGNIFIRCLGRQNQGECDKYEVTEKYFEFQNDVRSQDTLKKLAKAVSNFISFVSQSLPSIRWDFITYVSDKATTIPPNKMLEFFHLIESPIEKRKLFLWKDNVKESIRNLKNYQSRKLFVNENLLFNNELDIKGKNIIVIDDQYTTGATADSINEKLLDKGAINILFVTIFYIISVVESARVCPHCGTKLQIKINRKNGNRFLSCVLPKYGGKGCGEFIENIPVR